MITANITRSSTIRLNCDLVVLLFGLFLICPSSSWRISQSFDFPLRNDLVRLRRIFVFLDVTQTFLCSRLQNSIKYERAPVVSRKVRIHNERDVRSPQMIGISQNRKTQKCQYDKTRNCFNVHRAINCDWRVTRVSYGRNRANSDVYFFIQIYWFSKIYDYLPLKSLFVKLDFLYLLVCSFLFHAHTMLSYLM